jgi:Holliday junction resolvase
MGARTPEGKVKQKVVALLKELGFWYCFPVATGYGAHGVPDILICAHGRFIAVECKSGTNKPTALQEFQLAGIQRAGGVTFVVNEASLPAFVQWAREFAAVSSGGHVPHKP